MSLTGWMQAIGLSAAGVCFTGATGLFIAEGLLHCDGPACALDVWDKIARSGALFGMALAIAGANMERSRGRKRFNEEMRAIREKRP